MPTALPQLVALGPGAERDTVHVWPWGERRSPCGFPACVLHVDALEQWPGVAESYKRAQDEGEWVRALLTLDVRLDDPADVARAGRLARLTNREAE